MTLVTLTPQQLSTATSMVRWNPHSCRDVIDYLRAYTVDDPDLPEGEPIALAGSPAQLAKNMGVSAHTVRGALARLKAMRVVLELEPAAGSFPPIWFLSGDLPRWKVSWRVDPALAMAKVASLITCAPYSAQQRQITYAVHSAQQTGRPTSISCLVVVHRGPFAVHPRARSYGFGSYAHKTAQVIPPFTPAFTMPLGSSYEEPSSTSQGQQEKESIQLTKAAVEVLAAVTEVTGHELWGDPQRRVVEAVTPVEDAGYIVTELRRVRPPMWKAAVEMVGRLAVSGPPSAPPSSRPPEFKPEAADERPDPAAAAAALQAARSVLRPPAKWEDVG